MFPDGFLWGAATAAHQVEGNNVNSDCWLLEHLPDTIFAEPSGDACDHYHRYPQDIAILADLGLNAYRFSVEWARVEPEEGEFSTAVLEHYRRVLTTCRERGLTPVVTFHHFTSPRWLLVAGGWEDRRTADRFARYCERVTRHLGDLIGLACTLNESNLPRLLSTLGFAPPAAQRAEQPMWQAAGRRLGIPADRVAPFQFTGTAAAFDTMLAAHRAGSAAIKGVRSDLPVGWTLALADIQAGPGGEDVAARVRREVNEVYLEAAREDDFVGVQTYTRTRFGPDGPLPPEPGVELNLMGEEFYPEALEATIRLAAAVADVPVVVTENGLATGDDTRRQAYVERALGGVANCLRDGIDVRGYVYWTALDNFEWIFGYGPTFGLIAVDRATQRRTVKPSARWLGTVARTNGQALPAYPVTFPTMTEPVTYTLDVPGAVLRYDVREVPAGTAPVLLMIGSPMDASGFASLAEHFRDRTVVTYDPRGVGRSTRTEDAGESTPELHADDLHRLIAALGGGPVDVFASSGGAVNALALVARHPEQVRTLVAHEPPTAQVLPDRDRALAAVEDIRRTYERGGFGPAMAKFLAVTGVRGEIPADFADRPVLDPADFGMPTGDDGSRDDVMFAQNLRTITHFEPDFAALRAASTRIVVGVGAESEGEMAHRAGVAVADRLGTNAVTFPSHHDGFLGGEFGMRGDPDAFAVALRQVLAEGG